MDKYVLNIQQLSAKLKSQKDQRPEKHVKVSLGSGLLESAHSTESSAMATSTVSGPSNTSSSTKFTIEQKVASGAVKKGPYSVKRSVDPNEVVIKRRFGEGSRPLFLRDGININHSIEQQTNQSKHKEVERSSSTSSSQSSHDYCHRRSSSNIQKTYKGSQKSKKNLKNSVKKQSEEKVPYFIDQKREIDRIHRVYGNSTLTSTTKKATTEQRRSVSSDRSRERKRTSTSLTSKRRAYSRSSSRSPNSRSYVRHRDHESRRRGESVYRSLSYDRKRRNSSDSHHRCYHRHWPSRSRSRSRNRDCNFDRRRKRSELPTIPMALSQPVQYIPVPVALDYTCRYPPWPTQSTWPPPPNRIEAIPMQHMWPPRHPRPPPPPRLLHAYYPQRPYMPPYNPHFLRRQIRPNFRPYRPRFNIR